MARDIIRQIESRIGRHRYDMWFGRARLQVEGERVEVATASPFVKKWIDAHFSDDLRGIARDTIGSEARIDVRVAPELFQTDVPTSAHGRAEPGAIALPETELDEPADAAARQRPLPPRPPAAPKRRRPALTRTFEEFVVGPANRLAFATACRLIEEEPSAVSPLFIHGECGLGKTHLLQAICQRFAERTGRPEQVRYVTGEQFTNEYIASIRNQTIETFRRRVRRLDLLAIDDVHFLSNKVRTQSEFLQTLNEIDLAGARVVLSSDEHPRLIKKFSQALISRFLSGMVVELERPDRQTRISIVRRLASSRDVPMHDAAVEVVASRCVGSVRELEGAVTKLAALQRLTHPLDGSNANGVATGPESGEVGMVLVEQLFKDHGWQPVTPVRIGTVIDVVCARLGISRPELMSSSRHRRVVLGRGLVAYLGREMTTHSYPEIARALGRAYHSTIHTAHQRLARQQRANEVVDPGGSEKPIPTRELVDQLRHEILRATSRA
ncbi:MAG: AAA family ATPase [Planctomycetes bacterium]|nr:AAA family ATPase [Planctomycetota bacterium]